MRSSIILQRRSAPIFVAITLLLGGCTIDRSVTVPPGRDLGVVRVIDGDVHVEPDGAVKSLRVIDGNIRVSERGSIARSLRLTDGELSMVQATVGRDVITHHANIELDRVSISGDMELYCSGGEMRATTIEGELRVRKRALWYVACDQPKSLIIGPGSKIGKLTIDDTRIKVHISEDAIVGR